MSVGLVLFIATICFISTDIIGYNAVALILLMAVSLVAMLFDILPVLLAAVLSAVIWNFFFIPPVLKFHFSNTEYVLTFFLYFSIALVNAVLTFKIRDAENKARDKEERQNTINLYNTLLNSLSHELRTPIATIIGAVDTLKESNDKLTESNKMELLTEIDLASIRLNRQVDNLLNMSRLETGMLKIQEDWCDVNELIYAVIQKNQFTGINHPVFFEPDDSLPLFKLDMGLIEQVLHNLIHNAIQYTPEDSIIEISAIHQAELCVITIADQGKGFPVQELQHVFEKFYRLPNSKSGGSGLGLSIAKGFVEAHNGHLKLENKITGGAIFTIQIPAVTSFIKNLKNE